MSFERWSMRYPGERLELMWNKNTSKLLMFKIPKMS